MAIEISHIDYSDLSGGLVRMMDRFKEEGTLTGEIEDDDRLREDPNAALLGLLYDQRVRAESAFTGPLRLKDRLGHLDMEKVAEMDFDAFQEHFAENALKSISATFSMSRWTSTRSRSTSPSLPPSTASSIRWPRTPRRW